MRQKLFLHIKLYNLYLRNYVSCLYYNKKFNQKNEYTKRKN